jgi:hypothetical protein
MDLYLYSSMRLYGVVNNCLVSKHIDNFTLFILSLFNELVLPSSAAVTEDHLLSTVPSAYASSRGDLVTRMYACRQGGIT